MIASEWRARLTACLFGLVLGLVGGMMMLANESYEAHEDLAEFRSALSEARDQHRRVFSRLGAMEQRIYRRIQELPDDQLDQLADEIPGTWRAMVDKIMEPVRE